MPKRRMSRGRSRQINGRLQRWADFRRSPRYPGAGISGAYRVELPDYNRLPTSPQERWLHRHRREIRLSIAIERAFGRMTRRQRTILFRQYFLHETWGEIANALEVSGTTVYRDRQAAFHLLNEELERPRPADDDKSAPSAGALTLTAADTLPI